MSGAWPSLSYHPEYSSVRAALKAAAEEYSESPVFVEVEDTGSFFGFAKSPKKSEVDDAKSADSARERAHGGRAPPSAKGATASYEGAYRFNQSGLAASPLENDAGDVGYRGGPLDDDLYMDAPDLPLGSDGDRFEMRDEEPVVRAKKGRRCC